MKRALLALLAVSCRHAAPPAPLAASVQAVPGADAVAVVEDGGALYVFSAARVDVVRGGRVVASAPAPDAWIGAATMAALDGDGTWIVGHAKSGALWRVTSAAELERVEDRLGLPAEVSGIGATAGTFVAATGDRLEVVTGRHAIAFPQAGRGAVAVGRDRLALRGDVVDVWDLVAAKHARYPLHATAAAFAGSRLALATADALYVESTGGLHRMSAPGSVAALAGAGERWWVAAGGALYVVEGSRLRRVGAPAGDRLFGLPNGDVLVGTHAGLSRVALPHADDAWDAQVRPVFERVCARCHLPGGSAGVDLSTAATWSSHRADLVERVITQRTMPPAGIAIDDADRAALAAYLGR